MAVSQTRGVDTEKRQKKQRLPKVFKSDCGVGGKQTCWGAKSCDFVHSVSPRSGQDWGKVLEKGFHNGKCLHTPLY